MDIVGDEEARKEALYTILYSEDGDFEEDSASTSSIQKVDRVHGTLVAPKVLRRT